MKVAILIDSLAIGGAQKHVRQLACGLAEEGHAVTVWVLNEIVEPLYTAPMRRAGVTVEVLGRWQVASAWGLLRVAMRWNAEGVEMVVVCLFVSTVFGRLAAQLAGGIPVVTSLQARNLDYAWWQKALVKVTSRLSTWTISNSRAALHWAAQHEGVRLGRTSYVANRIDTPRAEGRLPTWTEVGLPQLEGRRVIGSLGRLNPQKGYDILLQAVALLTPQARQGLGVVIWGEGPERGRLERMRAELRLEELVFFPGQRADAAELLPKLALYVQPSRFEGSPNGVLEAVAAGIEVVASAVDGVVEDAALASVRKLPPDDVIGWAEMLALTGPRPQKPLRPSCLSVDPGRFDRHLPVVGKKPVEGSL